MAPFHLKYIAGFTQLIIVQLHFVCCLLYHWTLTQDVFFLGHVIDKCERRRTLPNEIH